MNNSMTKQKEAIIIKGIASQIMQMNVPTFDTFDKLLSEFDLKLTSNSDKYQLEEYRQLVYEIKEILLKQGDDITTSWILNRQIDIDDKSL